MKVIDNIIELVNDKNFSEEGYLKYNKDIANAVSLKALESGLQHYTAFGYKEERYQFNASKFREVILMRKNKMDRLKECLDFSLNYEWREYNKIDFLTEDLKKEFNITDTANVSSHGYDSVFQKIIEQYKDGLILDCGAGLRPCYYENIVNYEIVNYWSTDVIGVGEKLPFKDNSFDSIISVAVLEHVKDPFTCASEIIRVLKKGGTLYSAIPFLQPYHGYPHHYYNMTHQGHLNLYEKHLKDIYMEVTDALKPIHTLTWFLNSYLNGLPEEEKEVFKSKKINELLDSPLHYLKEGFVTKLSQEANVELACGTLLQGIKK